jgi:hypothetical protein
LVVALVSVLCSRTSLRLEVLALRHQLAVLRDAVSAASTTEPR